MVAKYVDISDILPGLDVAEDNDDGGDDGEESGSDSGGGAVDEPSRRVTREVQGSHASWTERIGLAQVPSSGPKRTDPLLDQHCTTMTMPASCLQGTNPTQEMNLAHTVDDILQHHASGRRKIKCITQKMIFSVLSAGGSMVNRAHAQHDGGSAARNSAAPLDRRSAVCLVHHAVAAASVRARRIGARWMQFVAHLCHTGCLGRLLSCHPVLLPFRGCM